MHSESAVVFITGASKRVGAALACMLHEKGYAIALHYRHSAMDVSEIEIFGGFDIDVNGHSSIPADDGDGFFHLAGGAQAILAFILKQSVLEESP